MRKKKNLWSGVSILIVAVLVITAFIRGNAQAWLLAAAFVIWAVWATYYFLVPYIKEELHKREAKRIRKKCEKQDAAFDRFIIPEVSDPVEQVLLRHANYRISAYLQSVYPNATWVWYEVQGRKVLEALITDLHSRGYNSLTIRENGDIAIQQADSEKVRTAFESVPEKPYWARLCKVFEREGMAANITDGGILLSW